MKNKILRWLFKRYAEELEHAFDVKIEAYKSGLDIKDVVRERLKGIRPNHPDDQSLIESHLAKLDQDEGKRLAFLSKAHSWMKDEDLTMIITSIMVESEHKAMLFSEDMVSVNFNRATINGLEILEEVLSGFSNQFLEANKNKEEMTVEEKFEVITAQ